MENPKCVLLFSGKRKSGKDYITDLLFDRLGRNATAMIKLSAPIKQHWAELRGLDLKKLLDSSEYKEQFREDMIKWGEKVRKEDYGYFCRSALEMCDAYSKSIWIVSDARRKTDMQWFSEQFGNKVKSVRVSADDDVRRQRGWTFTAGVDDAPSECDLDDVTTWDWHIVNNGGTDLEKDMQSLVNYTQNSVTGSV